MLRACCRPWAVGFAAPQHAGRPGLAGLQQPSAIQREAIHRQKGYAESRSLRDVQSWILEIGDDVDQENAIQFKLPLLWM